MLKRELRSGVDCGTASPAWAVRALRRGGGGLFHRAYQGCEALVTYCHRARPRDRAKPSLFALFDQRATCPHHKRVHTARSPTEDRLHARQVSLCDFGLGF
jgi:hypothetical protein